MAVRVVREQDSNLTHYPAKEIPAGSTVGDVQKTYRDELNLRSEMLCLVNGQPASMDQRLKDNDVLYWKEETKARG